VLEVRLLDRGVQLAAAQLEPLEPLPGAERQLVWCTELPHG
jgi:hypothetical protein